MAELKLDADSPSPVSDAGSLANACRQLIVSAYFANYQLPFTSANRLFAKVVSSNRSVTWTRNASRQIVPTSAGEHS